jgi:hypothetical protein
MVFRITPSLGMDVEQYTTKPYWDPPFITDMSQRPGDAVLGSDGHKYVLVKAHANLTGTGQFGINETTWVTTTNASGGWVLPGTVQTEGGVLLGDFFYARSNTLD